MSLSFDLELLIFLLAVYILTGSLGGTCLTVEARNSSLVEMFSVMSR